MREDLKRQLDDSVPEDVTLSEMKKRQILKAAQHQDSGRESSRVPKMLPALAGAALLGLGGILGFPYFSDWQMEQGALESFDPQELVVTGHAEYPDLITSVYDEQRERLIYHKDGKIYAYDAKSKTESVLVELEDGTQTYEFTVEGDWLAWEVFSDESNAIEVMNLETNERKKVEGDLMFDLNLSENQLIFAGFAGEDKHPSYQTVDLETMESTRFHELLGGGSNSGASLWKDRIVIPERVQQGDSTVTSFSVYDLDDKSLEAEFTLSYERAEYVTLMDNKVYAQLSDEELTSTDFGYMDLTTGKFVEIKAPDFDAYAIYGEYVAMSVADGKDSNDVELFKLNGTELEKVPAFASIKERLVKPRFTDDGTLVVNGEGEDRAMYLLDLEKR